MSILKFKNPETGAWEKVGIPGADITPEDIGAATVKQVQAAQSSADSKVPNTRKVNNKHLDADITLTAADIGAYTKDETLTANTAALFGLGADAVPNDAFKKLSESAYKVGDTLTTARTDLGDKWLLCNGAEVSAHDYSELAEMFPTLIGAWTEKDLWSGGYSNDCINCITYANGYWVAGGVHRDNNTYYARIAYTTDLVGDWTIKDLWSSNYTYDTINCITYANGYWVAGGAYCDGSAFYAQIAYTTDLANAWTTKSIWNSESGSETIECITYAEGYWVVGGAYRDRYTVMAAIAYTTDLESVWATKDLWYKVSESYHTVHCITYANGYWVAGGRYYDGSSYARIAYATSLQNTWTTKDLWSGSGNLNEFNCITYANGYWVGGGIYYDGSNSYARIAYTTDLVGTWTVKNLWGGNNNNSNKVKCITYANGYWMLGGVHYTGSGYIGHIAYTADLVGTWTIKDLWSGNTPYVVINCITYANGYWVGGGVYYGDTGGRARIVRAMKAVKLPAISQGTAYTYIKAKE